MMLLLTLIEAETKLPNFFSPAELTLSAIGFFGVYALIRQWVIPYAQYEQAVARADRFEQLAIRLLEENRRSIETVRDVAKVIEAQQQIQRG